MLVTNYLVQENVRDFTKSGAQLVQFRRSESKPADTFIYPKQTVATPDDTNTENGKAKEDESLLLTPTYNTTFDVSKSQRSNDSVHRDLWTGFWAKRERCGNP